MGINLDAADIIANIQETADGADIQLCFPYPAKSAFAEIAAVAREKLAAEGVANARFSLQIKFIPTPHKAAWKNYPALKTLLRWHRQKAGRQIHHRR